MNEKNLIPFSQRSESEVREMNSKGGIASGETRRKKKTLRMYAEIIGEQLAKNKGKVILDDNGEPMTNDALVVLQQYKKAQAKADTNAAKFVATIKGEFEEKHIVSGNVVAIVANDEQAKLIEKIAEQ